MDPLSLGLGIVGLGMQLFGGASAADEAKQQAALSNQVSGIQQQENSQRQEMAEIQSRRSSMEVYRNAQRARSTALSTATNQGAQMGSGLSGGYGQISGQADTNLLGISQSILASRQKFAEDTQINGLSQQIRTSQGNQAEDQGISSLGGAISGSAKTFGSLTQGFGSGSGSIFGSYIPGYNSVTGY